MGGSEKANRFMEITKIVVTPHAIQTLRTEFDWLKDNASVAFANKFRNDFKTQVDSILPSYLAYPECRFLLTPKNIYRNIIWGNYLIIYKIRKKEILVLGIFHTKQNPNKLKSLRRIKK